MLLPSLSYYDCLLAIQTRQDAYIDSGLRLLVLWETYSGRDIENGVMRDFQYEIKDVPVLPAPSSSL